MRGGLDAQGRLIALDYEARAADHNHLGYNEHDTVLIAQLAGMRKATPAAGRASTPSDMYAIPNRRDEHARRRACRWCGRRRCEPAICAIPTARRSPLPPSRSSTSWPRRRPSIPIEFRMRMLTAGTSDDSGFKRARSMAVLKAVAEKYGWEPRPAPTRIGTGEVLTGRGVAYAFRSQTVVAEIAEVEVNRRTGRVWVKRLVCAHDCGLVVNPEALRRTIEGGMLHSISRALHEESRFDTEKMTSVDWASYPTLTHADAPESIDIVLVNGDPNPCSSRSAALRRR